MDFLNENFEGFLGWECSCCSYNHHYNYDGLIYQLRDLLKRFSLVGYHCTKLTKQEISDISNQGLTLQDSASLSNRIENINRFGVIDKEIADKLTANNQANKSNRANKLWFIFYEPHLAGLGIEPFFRSWGGEALYSSHKGSPDTGKKLLEIGIPCIIKAIIPMSSLTDSYLPDASIIRAYLKSKGHSLSNGIEHEGFSIQNIPAEKILEISEYPNSDFIELTKCNEWEPPLPLPSL